MRDMKEFIMIEIENSRRRFVSQMFHSLNQLDQQGQRLRGCGCLLTTVAGIKGKEARRSWRISPVDLWETHTHTILRRDHVCKERLSSRSGEQMKLIVSILVSVSHSQKPNYTPQTHIICSFFPSFTHFPHRAFQCQH